jgi:ERCC4-related helicase
MNKIPHYAHTVGKTYEYFVLEQIKKDYDKVWHWSDFPEKLMYENNLINDYNVFCKYRYDIGADLVAVKNDKYYFIQCKNFNNTILMENLAGFYFLLYEYNLTGVLYYNGNLSQRVIDLSTNKIQFINLPFNNSTIDIITNIEKPLVIRDYQLDAYNKLLNKKNSILSLPCGMGKTFITSLIAKHYDNIIILSPLRYLSFQTLENFKKYLGLDYSPILISLDGKRNLDDINSYIKTKNIFSSTYDSVDIVIQLIDKLKNVYIIIDEFHNLSYNNINDNNNDMYKLINHNYDKIFVSATPLKEFMNITNIYNYDWKDAISNKYICDFNIFIPDKNEDYQLFVNMINKTCNCNNEKILKKAYFMLKSMLFNGDKKCICYMTTIKKANDMFTILIWLSKLLGIEIEYWQVDSNTPKTTRTKIINTFTETTKIAIIINVHILDEGINLPECDSVFITQPSDNIINIIQRMCRSNRITENKSNCNIYLWCKQNKADIILNHIFENTNGFIKDKVFIYNTNKQLIEKHIIKKSTDCKHNNELNTYNICDTKVDNLTGMYSCKLCNKKYSSYKSLWNHNKKFHNSLYKNDFDNMKKELQEIKKKLICEKKNVKEHVKSLTCEYCNKIFNNRPAKSIHKKKCKLKEQPDKNMQETIKELKTQVVFLLNYKNINK